MIGKILGDRYEIIEKIGEGGMSFVYKAKCNKLKRYVAVKILKDTFKDNEEIVEKFKREATAIANLSNANIVNVLDVGTQDNVHYIVMEYIKGKTLKEIIVEQGRLSSEVSISIATKIAVALECAHKKNIIHRDIKPQNILVTEDGTVKVTDFGIAKSADSSTISYTNSVMGSAHYFSPEQAKGSYIDCRTDIYSLGVVMYEMVTGRVPFEAESAVAVALKHIQEEVVSPKNINSSIPNSLNYLIMKAMEKEPVKRYQTAKDIISDLEKVKNDPNVALFENNLDSNDFTRVMAPVNVPIGNSQNKKDNSKSNNYEEDDDFEEDEEDDDNTPKKKTKTILIVALAAILLLAFGGISAYFLTSNKTPNKQLKVPENIIGMKDADAEAAVKKIGLRYVREGTVKSDLPEGTVAEATPGAGEKATTEVKVKLSAGEEKIIVPDLSSMTLEAVKAKLKDLNLVLGAVTDGNSDSIPSGAVISSEPAKDAQVTKGSKVNIVVSKGKKFEITTVPNVINKTKDEAEAQIKAAKLNVEMIKGDKKAPDAASNGKVYAQSIEGDSKTLQGTPVKVTYYDDYVAPKKAYKTSEIMGKSKKEAFDWANQRNIAITLSEPNLPDNAMVEGVDIPEVQEGGSIKVKLKAPTQ